MISGIVRKAVKSSDLAEVGHCPDTNTLEIMFHNGGVYQYKNVPADAHQQLLDAPSVGKHFHAHIKNSYEYTRTK